MWEVESAVPSEVSAQENSEVLFQNMQKMADYLVEMRREVREIKQKQGNRALQQTGLIGSGPSDEGLGSTSSTTSDIVPPPSRTFQVKLGVLEKSAQNKSVYAHATLDGVLVAAKFLFSKLDQTKETEVSVPFNRTGLAEGKQIIKFGTDAEDAAFLVMKATPMDGGDEVVNDVVFFGE